MILIDHARETNAERRGGGCEHTPLSDELAWVDIGSPELLDLNGRWTSWGHSIRKGPTRRTSLFSGLHGRGDGGADADLEVDRRS